jgi:hypothetical protein
LCLRERGYYLRNLPTNATTLNIRYFVTRSDTTQQARSEQNEGETKVSITTIRSTNYHHNPIFAVQEKDKSKESIGSLPIDFGKPISRQGIFA